MKKTLIAVLAGATATALLATAPSPAKAQDAGIVIIGSRVVVNQSPSYGGRAYTTDFAEPSPYGRAAYTPDVAEPSYYGTPSYRSSYGRPAYIAESPSPYGGPVYSAERPLPSPSRYYGPIAYQETSSCYWNRQRYWDGYSWTTRRVRVCD